VRAFSPQRGQVAPKPFTPRADKVFVQVGQNTTACALYARCPEINPTGCQPKQIAWMASAFFVVTLVFNLRIINDKTNASFSLKMKSKDVASELLKGRRARFFAHRLA
jgi:hypothetical protein